MEQKSMSRNFAHENLLFPLPRTSWRVLDVNDAGDILTGTSTLAAAHSKLTTMKETEAHPESVSGRLAMYLTEHKEEMTNEWVARLRRDSAIPTDTMTKPEIVDHIPQVFDAIIQALRQHRSDATMKQLHEANSVHAISRWQQDFHLPSVLSEVSDLRFIFIYHMNMFEEFNQDLDIAARLFTASTIHRILDEIAMDATEKFVKLTQGQPQRNAS